MTKRVKLTENVYLTEGESGQELWNPAYGDVVFVTWSDGYIYPLVFHGYGTKKLHALYVEEDGSVTRWSVPIPKICALIRFPENMEGVSKEEYYEAVTAAADHLNAEYFYCGINEYGISKLSYVAKDSLPSAMWEVNHYKEGGALANL